MTLLRSAARNLALSLSVTAAGTFCMVGAALPAPASVKAPVGGSQLAAPGVIVNLRPGVPPPPAMPGASFLLADMDTGKILVAKAPHARHLPASTLKTLTALTLIPLLDAKAKILVQPADVRVEGTHLGILAGTSYSVGTLLQGMLMVSGNDAAYALARANHSVAVTLKAMNATASELNAFDTVAKDPSGLDKPGESSSAYDLALIGRAAMKLPAFRRYVMTKQSSVPVSRSSAGKLNPGFKIGNHNKLIYNYPGAIGIKTGYTVAAQQTLVGAATRGGKTYLVTQMASANGSWRPPAALFDWAFAHAASVTPIGTLVEPGAPPTPQVTAAAGGLPQLITSPAPRNSALPPAFPPWIGAIALIGTTMLVGLWRRRHSRRRIAGELGARTHARPPS